MGVKTEAIVTWTCDRCSKAVVQKEMPCSANDPWGKLSIDQPTGFDHAGVAWRPRMREPLLLCSECIEDVVRLLDRKPSAAKCQKCGGRGSYDSPPGTDMMVTCDNCRGTGRS